MCAFGTGCCTAPVARQGPEEIAAAYAKALREDRLDDAWALTSEQYRAQVSRKAFGERYASESARTARADELDGAKLHVAAGDTALTRDKGEWRIAAEGSNDDGARKTLEAFVTAASAKDWKQAYALLSGALRARYTPERFASDFAQEPQAAERLARAKAALQADPERVGNEVRFGIGDGKAVRLVREAGGYRVAAIE
ncbi:MAG: hypothetical protein ACJ790_07590 [Myxococcaceae bacterium]